ncbi:MAG: outer membrane beta-barrel protein [Saprospiraceae bacterium]|nr:outer membrane beta-barrel protein [Saprospiraceae bacterium]
MSVRLHVLAGTLALFLSPVFLSAQIEDADIIFRELRALDGTWFMPQDRGDRIETWHLDNDSILSGREMRIKAEDGDTVLLETKRIELHGQVIMYYSTERGQKKNEPIGFELVLADAEGYLFENPENANPQKVRYRLLGNRELQISTEGRRNGRTVTEEFVFEREFTPAGVEFRLRAGANYFTQRGTGYLTASPAPEFAGRPSAEVGMQVSLRGNGGFITVNFEASLSGRSTHAKSAFTVFTDTSAIDYVRDVTYRQAWLVLAAIPEITLKRDGRLSILAGPYYGRLLFNKAKGTELPTGPNMLFDANDDFKKNDVGLIAGLQYKLNFGKKDIGGTLGLRANLGLANLDNLYTKRPTNPDPNLYNGRISLQGISLYYSMNLLKL